MAYNDEQEIPDLETVSLLTGIDHRHLNLMLEGKIFPGWIHRIRLEKVLPSEQVSLFLSHERKVPEYFTTKYGQVPSGYKLLRNMPAKNLQELDLLSYRVDTKQVPGTHWVQIEEVKEIGIQLWIIAGQIPLYISYNKPLRIARPVAS